MTVSHTREALSNSPMPSMEKATTAMKPKAPGQEATRTAFNPDVRLDSHLGLCDHWTLRNRAVGDPLGNLKKGIVEVIRALFGQGRSTDESCRHGSEQ